MEYPNDKTVNPAKNEGGQATLEYMLLLFIIVALCTGILMKFSVAFRTYGDAIVGGQLECALKNGKFPEYLPAGTCDEPEFKMAGEPGGSGGSGSGGTGSGGSGSGGGSENGTGGGAGKDSPGGSGSSDSASTDGGGAGSGGSDGGGSGGRSGRRFPSANANNGKSSGGKEDGNSSGDDGISRGNRKITVVTETVRVGGSGNSRYIPIVDSAEKPGTATTAGAITVKSDGTETKTSKKIPVNMEDRKPTAAKEDEPMSFAKFLRYLIIAAIVVAIFVFFGSQVMNFQNSKE